jgi:hypothetical protein
VKCWRTLLGTGIVRLASKWLYDTQCSHFASKRRYGNAMSYYTQSKSFHAETREYRPLSGVKTAPMLYMAKEIRQCNQ